MNQDQLYELQRVTVPLVVHKRNLRSRNGEKSTFKHISLPYTGIRKSKRTPATAPSIIIDEPLLRIDPDEPAEITKVSDPRQNDQYLVVTSTNVLLGPDELTEEMKTYLYKEYQKFEHLRSIWTMRFQMSNQTRLYVHDLFVDNVVWEESELNDQIVEGMRKSIIQLDTDVNGVEYIILK